MAKLSTKTKMASLKNIVGSMTSSLSASLSRAVGGNKAPKLLRKVKASNVSTDIKMGLGKFKG